MKLSELYKSLSDNQRFNFWTGTTNLFLCLFTFWAGLTLQFAVVDKATNYQSKLLYQEYDTKVTPKYLNLLEAERDIFLLYSKDDFDKIKETNKDLSSLLNKPSFKDFSKEKIQSITNTYSMLISNYDSIIRPSTETITNNAIDLRYVLPENKKKEIENLTQKILLYDAIYYALSNSKSQDELSSKLNDFFKSEKYTKNTRLAINGITRDLIIEDAIKIYNNAYDKSKLHPSLPINELLNCQILTSIVLDAAEIYLIYDNELGFNKQISWWDNQSLWIKSIIVLLCTFIGGMVIFIMFFKILCSQKTKRRPTREEYNDMKKNINNLQDQVEAFETDIDRLEHEIIRLGNPGNIPLKNKINYK